VLQVDLTTIDGLREAVADFDGRWLKDQGYSTAQFDQASTAEPAESTSIGEFNGTYCGRCSGVRRMALSAASSRCARLNPRHIAATRRTLDQLNRPGLDALALAIGVPPPIFSAVCLQCRTTLSLVVDAGPPVEVIVLGAKAPGLATAHTPDTIAYYLDQAYRSRTRGAFSAALVMYRAALEQFLRAQGYMKGTLFDRIADAVHDEPAWLHELDEDLMSALRKLGNIAVHPDDGDIGKQAAFDQSLVRDIEHVFIDVLDEAYEAPARRAERRQRLREARGSDVGS
jgi:hypothetical protein